MKTQRTLRSSTNLKAVPSDPGARAEATQPQSYSFGPFRLVPDERILRRGDQVLPLPPKAFETLLLLVRNTGHLMRKEDLMTALWSDSFVEEGSLTSQISLLRKVLADAGAVGAYIQTVPRNGYQVFEIRFSGVDEIIILKTWHGTPLSQGAALPLLIVLKE